MGHSCRAANFRFTPTAFHYRVGPRVVSRATFERLKRQSILGRQGTCTRPIAIERDRWLERALAVAYCEAQAGEQVNSENDSERFEIANASEGTALVSIDLRLARLSIDDCQIELDVRE